MALQDQISTEAFSNLPESLQEHYTQQKDGSYLIQITSQSGRTLEVVEPLKNALAAEKEAKQKAKEALRQTQEQMESLQTKLGEMDGWEPEEKVKEQIQAQVQQVREKAQREIEKAAEDSKRHRSQLEKVLLNEAASRALSRQKLVDHGADLLMPHVMSKLTIMESNDGSLAARVLDENGNPRISSRQGVDSPMTVDEFVESLAEVPAYRIAFAGSGATGSGPRDPSQKDGTGGRPSDSSLPGRSGDGGKNMTPTEQFFLVRGSR